MALKFNLICSGCHQRYTADVPNEAGTHTVYCPHCSAPYDVTVNLPSKKTSKTAPVSGPAAVAAKVRRCEIVSGVVWIIIGLIQCIAVFTAAAGVWNIVNAIVSLRNMRNIQPGNPHVVSYFDQRKVWLIVMAVVNIILGGVVGVLLVAFNWYVRDYVLQNRAAFEM